MNIIIKSIFLYIILIIFNINHFFNDNVFVQSFKCARQTGISDIEIEDCDTWCVVIFMELSFTGSDGILYYISIL